MSGRFGKYGEVKRKAGLRRSDPSKIRTPSSKKEQRKRFKKKRILKKKNVTIENLV